MSLTAEIQKDTNGSGHTDHVARTMIQMHIKECAEHRKETIRKFKETHEKIDKNSDKTNRLAMWIIIIAGSTGGGGILLNDNVIHMLKALF